MYRAAQTATLLGGRGKEEKLIHSVLIFPRVLSPIVALTVGVVLLKDLSPSITVASSQDAPAKENQPMICKKSFWDKLRSVPGLKKWFVKRTSQVCDIIYMVNILNGKDN